VGIVFQDLQGGLAKGINNFPGHLNPYPSGPNNVVADSSKVMWKYDSVMVKLELAAPPGVINPLAPKFIFLVSYWVSQIPQNDISVS
jgi:hypothetical protein